MKDGCEFSIILQAGTFLTQQFWLFSITLGSAGTAEPVTLFSCPVITPGKYPSALATMSESSPYSPWQTQ